MSGNKEMFCKYHEKLYICKTKQILIFKKGGVEKEKGILN